MLVAVLDACVLYPINVCNVLLRTATDKEGVLEAFEAIARSNQRPPNTLDAVLDHYRRTYPLTIEVLRPQAPDRLIQQALPGRGTGYRGH